MSIKNKLQKRQRNPLKNTCQFSARRKSRLSTIILGRRSDV